MMRCNPPIASHRIDTRYHTNTANRVNDGKRVWEKKFDNYVYWYVRRMQDNAILRYWYTSRLGYYYAVYNIATVPYGGLA